MHLLLTPLPEELTALAAVLRRLGHTIERGCTGRIDCLRLPSLGLTLAVGGHGKAQFAVQTQHFIDRLGTVERVICAGAAGSLASEVGVGDLVAATATVEHDYTLRFVQRPLPSFPGDAAALAGLRGPWPSGAAVRAAPWRGRQRRRGRHLQRPSA